ncbi:MAG TPA: hypothetical protein VHQ70_04605, partial [Syntrophomonadaceae bacterium]|nr:hypothetical protein [Syntrophomonadaceae bacterium]
AIAAAIVLALLTGCMDYFSVVAYAEMSSGVKIGVNRWDRVVSVEASTPESGKYIQEVNLKGRKIDQAVDKIVEDTVSAQPNHSDKPLLVITSTRNDKPERERLLRMLNKKVKQHSKENKTSTTTGTGSKTEGLSTQGNQQHPDAVKLQERIREHLKYTQAKPSIKKNLIQSLPASENIEDDLEILQPTYSNSKNSEADQKPALEPEDSNKNKCTTGSKEIKNENNTAASKSKGKIESTKQYKDNQKD